MSSFEKLFEEATGWLPHSWQTRFAMNADFPEVLSIPTGLGKTEGYVLMWLWKRFYAEETEKCPRRLVICLPQRSLVDQTKKRIETILDNLKRFEHRAKLKEVKIETLMGGNISKDWIRHPEDSMIIVGTQDQLLSRALNRGYVENPYVWPIHFAWLNNDCLWVMDEIQLMNSGLSTSVQLQAFRDKLETFGSVHTIWVSATPSCHALQTVDRKKDIDDYNVFSLSSEEETQQSKLLQAKKSLTPFEGKAITAETLLRLYKPNTLMLVIVNQVKRAQEIYRKLSKALKKKDIPLGLLHSRFRHEERKDKVDTFLDKGWKGILVTTQVVEAGIDISADTLVTEVSSWPSFVQRCGRCNRFGNQDGQIFWFDPGDKEKDLFPYSLSEIQETRKNLAELTEANPCALKQIPFRIPVARPVLRKKDLLELFSTERDLSGGFLDISPYVRNSTDEDIYVAFRPFDKKSASCKSPVPIDDEDLPSEIQHKIDPREIVSVRISHLRGLLKKNYGWRKAHKQWEKVFADDLVPGMTLILDQCKGGYHSDEGWTGEAKHIPQDLNLDLERSNIDDEDGRTFSANKFVTLDQHSREAEEEMGKLLASLPLVNEHQEVLLTATLHHDIGKAHPAFQEMLTRELPPGDEMRNKIWAKSKYYSKMEERPGFRHEVASMLQRRKEGASPLEQYLILAHHGKVRTRIQPRLTIEKIPDTSETRFACGVWDGDELKGDYGEICFDAMDFGENSWAQIYENLLDEHGPFRLAYLESLVRIADWRASNR